MKVKIKMRIALHIIRALIIANLATLAVAQEVSIPDPGLNAAVRETLQKPNGSLTEEDLLTLTALDAHRRNVSSISGSEAARNLTSLSLQFNHLIDLVLPEGLINLNELALSGNLLTTLTLPPDMT
ncbi:MAG: exported protein of unknown function [Verrucomicrobiales bacterium]|jgi:hypothetical protein|nr:exported protein of unknown function [Verrucomicrobiales bacterium]